MEGGCSKVLHVCVGTYSMIQYSYVLNISGSLDTKIFTSGSLYQTIIVYTGVLVNMSLV